MFLAFSSDSGIVLAPLQMMPNTLNPAPVIQTSHCRFCAQEKFCTELFDLTTNSETNTQLISMLKFFKIDFVDSFNAKIPKTICQVCYNDIVRCYNFFLAVKNAQDILKQIYCKDDDNENFIKLESVDCSDNGNNVDVKLEKNIQTDIFSETIEFETNPNILHQNSSSEIFNFEVKIPIFPINNTITSANEEDNENKKNKSEFKSECINQTSAKTEYLEIPCFEDNTNFVKVEDNICNISENKKIKNKKNKNIKTKNQDITYNGLPVFVNDLEKANDLKICNDNGDNFQKSEDVSWTNYPWRCKHCQLKCDTMQDLRNHSMQLHKLCFAYECSYCDEGFNMFHPFIEHVRRHRDSLRYYCPHCNERFSSVAGCTQHVLAYWSSGHKICNWCGEVYPNAEALNTHKSMTHQVGLPRKDARKKPSVVFSVSKHSGEDTWTHYEWGCLECALNFETVSDLRTHSQAVHDKCFAMRCADCLAVKYDYPSFVTHVVAHRPYLRKYCPYCNQQFEDPDELKKHTDDHLTGANRACYGCGQTFRNKEDETQHLELYKPRRTQKYLTTEDLTCQVCRKVYDTPTKLRKHKTMHDKTRKKDHFCHLCGQQFNENSNLKFHMNVHNDKKTHECKVCNKSFVCERYLINHVLTHSEEKPFICDYCSKGFARKHMLVNHIDSKHNSLGITKKHKCTFCPKMFRTSSFLKIHLNVHLGVTPYQCQNCEKSFTNWANCNKHMTRIHGNSLASNRLTKRGRVPIGAEMPEISTNVKGWMAEVTKSRRDTPKRAKSKKGKN